MVRLGGGHKSLFYGGIDNITLSKNAEGCLKNVRSKRDVDMDAYMVQWM